MSRYTRSITDNFSFLPPNMRKNTLASSECIPDKRTHQLVLIQEFSASLSLQDALVTPLRFQCKVFHPPVESSVQLSCAEFEFSLCLFSNRFWLLLEIKSVAEKILHDLANLIQYQSSRCFISCWDIAPKFLSKWQVIITCDWPVLVWVSIQYVKRL